MLGDRVGFLRRLLGGGGNPVTPEADEPDELDAADLDASERAHELEVLRAEQERLDDLTQRQLRYADYAWQPPAQGGDRRADDDDPKSTSG
jgi:hypothetical protein